MAERVGRVEHIHAPAEALAVLLPREQVADQRFTGGNQLIGQNVPGTDLQAARADQLPDPICLLRSDPEVVFQQNGLAVQHKGELGLRAEAVEKVVDGRNQPAQKDRLWEVPFPVPVGMWDQMEGVPGHCRES